MRNSKNGRTNPVSIVRRTRLAWSGGAAVLAAALMPVGARADVIEPAQVSSWLAMATASQNAQPHWMTPLVTVTPRLEQEIRWDFYDQHNGSPPQGNDQHLLNYGGPGGLRVEFIPTYDTEIIVATPPTVVSDGPKGFAQGAGDWPMFLAKYRFISANEQNGNYIVSGFFQMSEPLGTPAAISSNVWIAQPTLAFGKGWGDFDIQVTLSEQFPFEGRSSATATADVNLHNYGDPVLANVAFQYHFMKYFWPELEVNYEYWPNGIHKDLSQVLLTPGIIFGRFNVGSARENLILGVGYQIAVTKDPVIANNIVATLRLTF